MGHEGVRLTGILLASYQVKGDPMWLLRSLRTIGVKYMRALSLSYPQMSTDEKVHLMRLMLYEGFQSYLVSLETEADI